MSDPRPPDDGPGWPERDLDEKGSEEPAAGWSDDPYRYEPPPRYEPPAWDPPVFEPPKEGESPEWERPVWEPIAAETSPQAPEPPHYEPPAWEAPGWEPRPIDEPVAAAEELPAAEEPFRAEEPISPDEPVAADEPPPAEEPIPSEEPAQAEEPVQPEEPEPAEEAPLFADEPVAADPVAPQEAVQAEEPESAAEEPLPAEQQLADEPLTDEPIAEERPAWQPPHEDEAAPPGEPPPPADEASPPADEPPLPDEPAYPLPPPETLAPVVEAAEPTTAFGGSANDWDPKLHGNRRRSTTAEQAVPWLIGIILALAGMVIVLLALIFSSPDGLVAGQTAGSASPSASASASKASGAAAASSEPSGDASEAAEPSGDPAPTPEPKYGALEMMYLGRPSGTAPIYLLRRDFAKGKDPEVLAQAKEGVQEYAWSPDGQVGAAVISNRAVSLRPGHAAKELADRVSALTFGWDSETLYAVRINRDGDQDRAHILEIDCVSGATKVLARIDYRHPDTAPEAPLNEAQFIDDGGKVRIYAVADGNLAVWILGAPDTYRIDPADGNVTKIAHEPTLWSPDGRQRITPHENGTNTILRLRNRDGDVTSAVTVNGLVSHVRWAGSSNEIVFTLGTLSGGGGVRQDLYVWDLRDGKDPMPLTSSGAAFGADWRGVMSNWAP